jgi:hypothetical protein
MGDPWKLIIANLKDGKIDVDTHGSLETENAITQKLLTRRGLSSEAIYTMYPPVLLSSKAANKYLLVARHWVFARYIQDDKYDAIPCIVISDPEMTTALQNFDEAEQKLLDMVKSTEKQIEEKSAKPGKKNRRTRSKTTKTRDDALDVDQVCALNSLHVMRYPRKKPEKDKYGFFMAKCNETSKGCTFYARLTEYELELLKNKKLPTGSWLIPLHDEFCTNSDCRAPLYERIIRESPDDPGVIRKVCSNFFRIDSDSSFCDYMSGAQ